MRDRKPEETERRQGERGERDERGGGGGGEREGRLREKEERREREREDDGRIHPVSGSLPSEKMAHESKHQKRVASRKIENVEELETPSASTKPRI